jgi:flagellar basal-body rod protein FlgF
MSSTTYIALSSQMALRRQLDVVANNVANASTPAFKAERMIFAEYLGGQGGDGGRRLSFVHDVGTERDTRQGALTQTGNPLDVAIQGDGYFTVQTPLGPRYTRNGRWQLDAQGQLVTPQGYALLGEGEQPIQIPQGAADLSIGRDGTINTSQGFAGKVGVVGFDKEQALRPAANGLYVTDAAPQPASPDTAVVQGMIEESNVQPIVEITRMMSLSRNFGFAKEMLDGESERAKTAIDKLGKVA